MYGTQKYNQGQFLNQKRTRKLEQFKRINMSPNGFSSEYCFINEIFLY